MAKHISKALSIALPFALFVTTDLYAISPEGKTFVTPVGVTLLTEPEIIQMIVGNTFMGETAKGGMYYEYYTEDGHIRGLVRGEKYSGKWKVKGSVICFDYNDPSHEHCSTLSVNEGGSVRFYDLKGKRKWLAIPQKGNSKGL